jgi:hypothetical protein
MPAAKGNGNISDVFDINCTAPLPFLSLKGQVLSLKLTNSLSNYSAAIENWSVPTQNIFIHSSSCLFISEIDVIEVLKTISRLKRVHRT